MRLSPGNKQGLNRSGFSHAGRIAWSGSSQRFIFAPASGWLPRGQWWCWQDAFAASEENRLCSLSITPGATKKTQHGACCIREIRTVLAKTSRDTKRVLSKHPMTRAHGHSWRVVVLVEFE